MTHCMPHVPVDGSYVDTSTWRGLPGDGGPTVLCGKCWKRVHPFLEVIQSYDEAALRRYRKRRSARRRRAS